MSAVRKPAGEDAIFAGMIEGRRHRVPEETLKGNRNGDSPDAGKKWVYLGN